jgi:hypothetical protein
MSFARLSRRPLLFKSFTGLAVSELHVIAIEIESKYDEYERRRLYNRKRERDVGAAGRPFKLKAKERFLMLLVYYRLYITFTLSGFLFDKDNNKNENSNASNISSSKDISHPEFIFNLISSPSFSTLKLKCQ